MQLLTLRFTFKKSGFLDDVGTAASILCAVHCAALPFALALFPLFGTSVFVSERVEWILFGVSALLATSSLGCGYKRHRSRSVLAVLCSGLLLLSLGRIVEGRGMDAFGTVLMVCGGLTLAVAHRINRCLCRIGQNSCHC